MSVRACLCMCAWDCAFVGPGQAGRVPRAFPCVGRPCLCGACHSAWEPIWTLSPALQGLSLLASLGGGEASLGTGMKQEDWTAHP